MSNIDLISDCISKIDLTGRDPLEFLIENNINTNPFHNYIVRKIVSQLEVRDHIHNLGAALKIDDPKSILRSNNSQ